jgi:DNA-binding transcriptional ArsR family regulator
MLERYELESIEQLRAIADMLRLRIIDLLQGQPMTVTQLGDVLGVAPAKAHYHVRELEKVGLLELVETREKGGILEKYYQPIARSFTANSLLDSAPVDEVIATVDAWFDHISVDFQRAFRQSFEQKDIRQRTMFGATHLYLTIVEQEQLGKQIGGLLKDYEQRRGIEGEQEVLSTVIMYPHISSATDPFSKAEEEAITTKSSWTVGTVNFSEEDLEKTLSEGKRLRINVTGICRFADAISPDLAERAVEQFHLIGKLQASSAVREVLMRKHL